MWLNVIGSVRDPECTWPGVYVTQNMSVCDPRIIVKRPNLHLNGNQLEPTVWSPSSVIVFRSDSRRVTCRRLRMLRAATSAFYRRDYSGFNIFRRPVGRPGAYIRHAGNSETEAVGRANLLTCRPFTCQHCATARPLSRSCVSIYVNLDVIIWKIWMHDLTDGRK